MKTATITAAPVANDSIPSATDAYLVEHAGLIRSAQRIIKNQVERNGKVTRLQVAQALLRIPNVRRLLTHGEKPVDVDRLRMLLSTAARRGAFPGYKLSRRTGFRAINPEIAAEKKAEIALQSNVIEAAKALFSHLGMDVTFTPKATEPKVSAPKASASKSNVIPFRARKPNTKKITWNQFQHENKGKLSFHQMVAAWRGRQIGQQVAAA